MNKSYWSHRSVVPINHDEITIPANNGKSFSSDNHNHILIDIPKNVPFFLGADSYLRFRIKLEMVATTAVAGNVATSSFCQLIPELGANSIIKSLRIRNSQGVILEEINNYNCLKLLMNQYDLSEDRENLRSITEGVVLHDFRTRVNDKTTRYINKSSAGNTATNPYFETKSDGTTAQKDVDICLPLNASGILGNADKVCPNALIGVRIEIELEEGYKCIRASRIAFEDPNYNPKISFGRTTAVPPVVGAVGDGLPVGGGGGNSYDRIYISNTEMNMTQIEHNAFKVGEFLKTTMDNGTDEIIGQIKSIGMGSSIAGGDNFIYYELEAPYTPTNDVTIDPMLFSNNLQNDGLQTLNLRYDITNLEYVIKRIEVQKEYLDQMTEALRSAGQINYEFNSFSNYTRNVLATEVNSTMNLPLQNNRARSLLLVGTIMNSSQYENLIDFLDPDVGYNHFSGVNKVNSYQLSYENRLHPQRVVSLLKNTTKKSFPQVGLHELSKALVQANIAPNSMINFKNNMIIGRSFSTSSGFYNTIGKDTQINIDFSGIAGQTNKLYQIFCAHIRRIVINNSGISVVV